MIRNDNIDTSCSNSAHRPLRRTLVLSVILFSRNKPKRIRANGAYTEILCVNLASHACLPAKAGSLR